MSSLTKLFTRPSSNQIDEEFGLGIQTAQAITADAKIEQEAIVASADATSDAAEFNANILRRNSRLAVDSARIDAARVRRKSRRQQGAQNVAIAGSGFTTAGFEDLITDSASEDEMDALLITRQGRIQAESLLTGASLQIRGAADAQNAASISLNSSASTAKRRASAAILSGQNRANAVRRSRRNAGIEAVVGTAVEVAQAAAGGGNKGRLAKVMF